MKKNRVFALLFCAIMASLAIVLDKLPSIEIANRLKFTFYGLPLMIVGITLGFRYGLLSGIIAGVVLQLTSKWGIGITSIFWAMAPVAWGGVSGIVYQLCSKKHNLVRMILTVVLASLTATLFNTFAMFMDLALINDSSYTMAVILTDLPFRVLSMIILCIPYILLLMAVAKVMIPLVEQKR